jgi:hypothetical protein
MADANYVLLEKITVGAAGASSVTFSGIPQTGYTDLVVKVSARMTAAATGEYIQMSFNGVTTNLSSRLLYGYTTAASSYDEALIIPLGQMPGSTTTASTFGSADIYIPNYTSSNYKSVSIDQVSENNASTVNAAYQYLQAGLWSSTAAINSITLTAKTGNLAASTTFYLYGVAKLGTTPAIVPYATGGDTIMTDGTYWYHAFVSSGTFTPTKALSADVLVIAGGGAGGGYVGGGGGAGGFRGLTAQSLITTGYTVTIGGGGASAAGIGGSGSTSTFNTSSSSGGGGGGSNLNTATGSNGGSGGGGQGGSSGGTGNSGSYSPVEGFNGGSGIGSSPFPGGGGGGATAVGANGSAGGGGNGGAGSNAYSTWATATLTGVSGFYAGGGGGGGNSGAAGTGGSGGGGNASTPPANGVANTGSGGGGNQSGTAAGSNGGSGLVIVRYAI